MVLFSPGYGGPRELNSTMTDDLASRGYVVVSHTNPSDPSWGEFWAKQRAWKRDLHLIGGAHLGFTDTQFVMPALGSLLPPARKLQLIGEIDPVRSLKTQHDYLAAYFDLQLKGRDRHLFDGNPPRYPDAKFFP